MGKSCLVRVDSDNTVIFPFLAHFFVFGYTFWEGIFAKCRLKKEKGITEKVLQEDVAKRYCKKVLQKGVL